MTLNINTGATAAQKAVDDQIKLATDGDTILTPTEVAVILASAYDAYAKEGTLSGGDLSAGGTKSILDTGFISDNTSATVTNIATEICNYWSSNNAVGAPTHGGTSVQSVTIDGASKITVMTEAIEGFITDQPDDGWVGFYNVTQTVVKSIQCTIVELIQPGNVPTEFIETIT